MKFIPLFFGVAATTIAPAFSYSFLRGDSEKHDVASLFDEIEDLKSEFQGHRNLGTPFENSCNALQVEINGCKNDIACLKGKLPAAKEKVKAKRKECKPKTQATRQAQKQWVNKREACKKFSNKTTSFDIEYERLTKVWNDLKDERNQCQQKWNAKRQEANKAPKNSEKQKQLKKQQGDLLKKRDDLTTKRNDAQKAQQNYKKNVRDPKFKECRDNRDDNQKTFVANREASKPCERELRKAANLKERLKTRIANKQAIRKSRRAARRKRKRQKNRRKKSKVEVEKELVAGQCVADHYCATIRGDPHITTYDGLRFDCQGEGEFVLAKTIDSDNTFEVQGRFKSTGKSKMVTITQGISITTGVEGEPDLDVYTEEVDGTCVLMYYVDGNATDFSEPVPGISFEDSETDYIFYTGSGIMYSVSAKDGKFGCVLNSKLCLPRSLVDDEDIVGLLGTPDGSPDNDWTTPSGAERNQDDIGKPMGYAYCTTDWCVRNAEDSIFGYLEGTSHADYFNCDAPYDADATSALELDPPAECEECCTALKATDPIQYSECLEECSNAPTGEGVEQCVIDIEDAAALKDSEKKCKDPVIPDETDRSGGDTCATDTRPCPDGTVLSRVGPNCVFKACPDDVDPTDATTERAFTRGDPHFKTFGSELYDFHGECDLVLLHNPEFKSGLGMDVHIRTKITDWWSAVESAAVKIGKETLEIQATEDSDSWLWINGKVNDGDLESGKWYRSSMAGFLVRYRQSSGKVGITREAKIYLEGSKEALELKTFKSFVRVDIAWMGSENYYGSSGLLGSHEHNGARLGRDGVAIDDVNAFGQEWQVRADEPQLFHSYDGAIVPPMTCKMPDESTSKQALRKRRLAEGMPREEAEAACDHLADEAERDACVYDVLATQDLGLAGAW